MSTLLIAVHGTRAAAGRARIDRLITAVRAARPIGSTEVGFFDVQTPSVAAALAALPGATVVVPALLSGGYHLRHDIPDAIGTRGDVRVARHLGPATAVVTALRERLGEAGAGGDVTLVAAPSADPAAAGEVRRAAEQLATAISRRVTVAILGADVKIEPTTDVAAYLLAEGAFYSRAVDLAPTTVTAPLADHPAIAKLIWERYDEALAD